MLRATVLAGTFLLASLASPIAIAGDATMPRTITLTGHGEVRQVPDIAIVTAGVLTQSTAAGEALASNAAAMQKVFAALKAAGIADKDIQTSNFIVQPRYDYNRDGQAPLLVGYDVSNNVTVVVRKLDGLGPALDSLVNAGANQILGVQFSISEPRPAQDEARKLAVADARNKADLYATAASVKLGKVLSMSEGSGFEPPRPVMQAKMAAEAMPAPTPIAAGEQTVTVDVNITWEIE